MLIRECILVDCVQYVLFFAVEVTYCHYKIFAWWISFIQKPHWTGRVTRALRKDCHGYYRIDETSHVYVCVFVCLQVEQIVDMECQRRWKCPVKFRVRWAGYSEKDDTWLPASELSCEDLIKEFLEISGRSSEYKVSMPCLPFLLNVDFLRILWCKFFFWPSFLSFCRFCCFPLLFLLPYSGTATPLLHRHISHHTISRYYFTCLFYCSIYSYHSG